MQKKVAVVFSSGPFMGLDGSVVSSDGERVLVNVGIKGFFSLEARHILIEVDRGMVENTKEQ
jgi:hypothetical protein